MGTAGLILILLLCALLWAYFRWGRGGSLSVRPSVALTLPPTVSPFSGTASRRRTERVRLSLPILVTGQDTKGQAFQEETHTVDISGHGASIVVRRPLKTGQEIVISRADKSRQATCRVVREIGQQAEGYMYGVAFVDPGADLWGMCSLLMEAKGVSSPQTRPTPSATA